MDKTSDLGLPQGDWYVMTEIVRQRERQLIAVLSQLGLTLHEWRVLRILYSFTGDLPMSKVIDHSQTDRSALGRTVDRLVARGWVLRFPAPTDKRAIYLRIDPSSREMFDKVLRQVAKFDEKLISVIDDDERAALSQTLKKIASTMPPNNSKLRHA